MRNRHGGLDEAHRELGGVDPAGGVDGGVLDLKFDPLRHLAGLGDGGLDLEDEPGVAVLDLVADAGGAAGLGGAVETRGEDRDLGADLELRFVLVAHRNGRRREDHDLALALERLEDGEAVGCDKRDGADGVERPERRQRAGQIENPFAQRVGQEVIDAPLQRSAEGHLRDDALELHLLPGHIDARQQRDEIGVVLRGCVDQQQVFLCREHHANLVRRGVENLVGGDVALTEVAADELVQLHGVEVLDAVEVGLAVGVVGGAVHLVHPAADLLEHERVAADRHEPLGPVDGHERDDGVAVGVVHPRGAGDGVERLGRVLRALVGEPVGPDLDALEGRRVERTDQIAHLVELLDPVGEDQQVAHRDTLAALAEQILAGVGRRLGPDVFELEDAYARGLGGAERAICQDGRGRRPDHLQRILGDDHDIAIGLDGPAVHDGERIEQVEDVLFGHHRVDVEGDGVLGDLRVDHVRAPERLVDQYAQHIVGGRGAGGVADMPHLDRVVLDDFQRGAFGAPASGRQTLAVNQRRGRGDVDRASRADDGFGHRARRRTEGRRLDPGADRGGLPGLAAGRPSGEEDRQRRGCGDRRNCISKSVPARLCRHLQTPGRSPRSESRSARATDRPITGRPCH